MKTNNLFEQALLSEAAYADFWDEENNQFFTDEDDVKEALERKDFTPTQAQYFVDNWQLVSHQPNTDSGFSATLFQRITDDPVSGYKAGDYAYAIRGTELGWTNLIDLAEEESMKWINQNKSVSFWRSSITDKNDLLLNLGIRT